jgi:hypothetical protein
MWYNTIRTWFGKFRQMMEYHQIKKDVSQLTEYQPSRQLCEKLFMQLNPVHFLEYEPFLGISCTITPLYSNIEIYTLKLKEFTRLVKQERPISPDWNADIIAVDTNMDRFFISTDGYYLDLVKSVSIFKEAGLQLCTTMNASDIETHGVQEHNLRILTKLFVNMRHTTTALINVSLTKNV